MMTRQFVYHFFHGLQGLFIVSMIVFLIGVAVGWSGFFISPQSILITPNGTVLVRATPFGAVNADWTMEAITMDGTECPSATGSSIIQVAPNDTVRLSLPPELVPCIQPRSVVNLSFQVRFFGIALRPVYITTIVEN
jgi:hypothetical protein